MRRLGFAVASLVLVVACAPRLTPLTGAPVAAEKLPRTTLARGKQRIVFNWEFSDREMTGRGEGAARIAYPDSARLDFYLAGGLGSGAAVLIGDSVVVPGIDLVRRVVPPPALLWASLGRVALPNRPDTVIKAEGSLLRADIGRPVEWRLTFRRDTLVRAERVEGGRVVEWMDRSDPTHIRYRDEGSRRSLQLSITRTEQVSEFDASIWRLDR